MAKTFNKTLEILDNFEKKMKAKLNSLWGKTEKKRYQLLDF